MESLDQCLDALGVEGLSGIVITHLHHDHVGGVPGLLARYGVDLPVYKSEVPIELFATVTAIEAQGLMEHFVTTNGEHAQFNPKTEVWVEGYEETLPLDLDVSDWAPGIDSLEELRRYFYFSYSGRQFCDRLQVTREMNWQPLEDGTVVRTDGATLRCLHTPGHAVDHSSFLLMEEHAVLSGDTVLGFGTTVVHDMYDYMATLRRLLDARPMRLYPGHGPVIENGSDFIGRYIQHREVRRDDFEKRARPWYGTMVWDHGMGPWYGAMKE
jgi:glyoxylase-like metal-dependent hydrolase (beta-lactamase superfamily II)